MNLLAKLVRSAGLGVAVKACESMAAHVEAGKKECARLRGIIEHQVVHVKNAQRREQEVRDVLVPGRLGWARESLADAARRVVSERDTARRDAGDAERNAEALAKELEGLRSDATEATGDAVRELADRVSDLEETNATLRERDLDRIARIATLEQQVSAANARAEVHARNAAAHKADAVAMANAVTRDA